MRPNCVLLADLISIFYIPLLNPSAEILNKIGPVTDARMNHLICLLGAVEGTARPSVHPAQRICLLSDSLNHRQVLSREPSAALHLGFF